MIRRLPGALVLLPPAGLLVAVLVSVYQRFDPTQGFDYPGHLDYVRYIDLNAALPMPDMGWQMYQPPAYYVLNAALFEALHLAGWAGTITDAGRWLASASWVLEGVVAVAAVRVLGGSWVAAAAAAVVAWLLPGQSMMGSMLYNETLTGLAVGMMTLGVVLWHRKSRPGLVLLGAGFLLALLSKYSGLAAAAGALPIIVRVGWGRLRPTLAALAPGVLVGGAYYLRNFLAFGTPVPLNAELFHLDQWDPLRWGHPPGLFTTLSIDKCAALDSFWGGLWKWFWATDCIPLPWPDSVSGPLLAGALLGTALWLVALVWATWRSLRDPVFLFLAGIPAMVFVAFMAYNLRVPSATVDKGVYILAGLVPVAVVIGLFIDRFWGRWVPAAYVLVLAWGGLMVYASGLG